MIISDGNVSGYVGNGNSGLLVRYLKKYKNSNEWSYNREFDEGIVLLHNTNLNLTVRKNKVYIEEILLADFLNNKFSTCKFCGKRTKQGTNYCTECKKLAKICSICGQLHTYNYEFEKKYYCHVCYCREFIECNECGEIYKKEEFVGTTCDNGNHYCTECAENVEFWYCDRCGSIHDDIDELTEIDDQFYCETCRDNGFYQCDDCGEWISSHICLSNGNEICYSCYENNGYFTCDNCGEIFSNDYINEHNDEFFCDDCYREITRYIHNYDYKPDFKFHGTGHRFFGLEIETDDGENPLEFAEKVSTNFNDFIYCVHDGSLSSEGVECVTMPATIEFLKETGKLYFEGLRDFARENSYLSHDTSTCGLHIHVSRDGINDSMIEKMIYLFERNFSDFLKLSRRTRDQLSRWANRYFDDYEEISIDKCKDKMCSSSRYKAINLQNSKTIEFRFFRGTLNVDTILASIELIDNLVDYAKNSQNIENATIIDIIKYKETDYLIEYAKKRRIDV